MHRRGAIGAPIRVPKMGHVSNISDLFSADYGHISRGKSKEAVHYSANRHIRLKLVHVGLKTKVSYPWMNNIGNNANVQRARISIRTNVHTVAQKG